MKELKFIHITKTAGTSIEDKGFSKGFLWGRFHEEYGWHHGLLSDRILREKYDWFTVVRNPYERLVSEFHCFWAKKDQEREAINKHDKKMFNKILRKNIQEREKDGNHGNHYTEQYKYLEGIKEVRVLRFENLKVEFDELMEERGIDLRLDIVKNIGIKTFSVADLDFLTINLINDVYKQDFLLFEYETISKNIAIL